MGHHLIKHGDGVKDIAMSVDDLDNIVKVSQINFVKQILIKQSREREKKELL